MSTKGWIVEEEFFQWKAVGQQNPTNAKTERHEHRWISHGANHNDMIHRGIKFALFRQSPDDRLLIGAGTDPARAESILRRVQHHPLQYSAHINYASQIVLCWTDGNEEFPCVDSRPNPYARRLDVLYPDGLGAKTLVPVLLQFVSNAFHDHIAIGIIERPRLEGATGASVPHEVEDILCLIAFLGNWGGLRKWPQMELDYQNIAHTDE
mmetsp:Transcript_22938/g.50956  ORF Transcript_22938/g.50956 Transcript_22938/m.50956 type:complete len:209 (+) Transcript_22938:405-1031(+)